MTYEVRPMPPSDLAAQLAKIRWCTSSALSGFENLDVLKGYDCARIYLGAIDRILDEIDRADDLVAVPQKGRIKRAAR